MLTVVAAAATKDLTVLDTVKRELGLATGEHDALLRDHIRQASAAIVSYCSRELAQETVEQTFRLYRGMEFLQLARWPLVSVTSVTEAGVALGTADYERDDKPARLYRLGSDTRIAWAADKIVVRYDAGYALLTTLPPDIARACVALVRQFWHGRARDPMVKAEEVPGVYRQELWVGGFGGTAAWPPEITALLDPYRDIRTG